MTASQIRDDFESRAHQGYISYGLSMTDGRYVPESREAFTESLRRKVPVTPDSFRYNTDFQPTQEECDAYNAVFAVGEGWRPDHLDLAVRWEKGWRSYEVTGTRHAYYLLRKLALRDGFQGARLRDVLVHKGYATDSIITLVRDDVLGSDRFGKYRALLDRNNAHYDLQRDELDRARRAREHQEELDRMETESDRAAWRAQDA